MVSLLSENTGSYKEIGSTIASNAKTTSSNDEEEKGKFIRRERYSGECSRSFYIGEEVEDKDIKASFDKGILKLEIPKKLEEYKEPEKKYIEIL